MKCPFCQKEFTEFKEVFMGIETAQVNIYVLCCPHCDVVLAAITPEQNVAPQVQRY